MIHVSISTIMIVIAIGEVLIVGSSIDTSELVMHSTI